MTPDVTTLPDDIHAAIHLFRGRIEATVLYAAYEAAGNLNWDDLELSEATELACLVHGAVTEATNEAVTAITRALVTFSRQADSR